MATHGSIALAMLVCLGICASAAPAGLDPVKNMCMRYYHQSAVKGGTLYIHGGLETFAPNNTNGVVASANVTEGYNEDLIAIDLTEPWNWKHNITERTMDLSLSANSETGSQPPEVRSGALYTGAPSDTRIYLYGGTSSYWNTSFPGWQYPTSQQYVLWSYDTVAGSWDQFDISSGSYWRPSSGLAAEAPDQGLAFYLNGELDSGSSMTTQDLGDDVKVFLQGMIVINTTAQTAVNLSTNAVVGSQPRTRGSMSYIPPFGPHGILIAIGGSYKATDELDNEEMTNFVSMNRVDVFDIDAYYRNDSTYSGWFKQSTTGDIPQARAEFCSVVISTPDNSSHSIYLYGGHGANNAVFDDMYVLSIPEFIWTQVYGPGKSPRWGHTCHAVGRMLVTVGGFTPASTCDWEDKGVGVMDLSSLVWGSVFTPNTTNYILPTKVAEAVASTTASAGPKQPVGGFSDPALAPLFGVANTTSSTPPAPTEKAVGGRHRHIALIVGSAVGGTVFLALVVIGAVYYWRRRSIAGEVARRPQVPEKDYPGELTGDGRHELEYHSPNELGESCKHELRTVERTCEMEAEDAVRHEMQG